MTNIEHARHPQPITPEFLSTFDGFLERLANSTGVATLSLVRDMPGDMAVVVAGSKMPDILEHVRSWGAVLLILEGRGMTTGISVEMPQVFEKDGYHHFFGAGGFGGHIAAGACQHVAFIDRPFQGRRSLSIHFYDETGEPMFKLFVARELSGDMKPDQVEAFFRLRDKITSG